MIRELTGRVWDDSRTEPGESENPTANDVQYMANGIYSKKDEKHNRALTNGNVPEEYKNPDAIEGQKTEVVEETKDLKVRSAKAELVEIVASKIAFASGDKLLYDMDNASSTVIPQSTI